MLGHLTFAGSPDSVVVFNEIHYHPKGSSKDGEWVEVFNQMGIRTDVSGWRIKGINYTFPDGTIIAPGAYLVVRRKPVAGQLGPFTGSLDDQGERIELFNKGNRLMDELDFKDSGRWPIEADGSGATLAKRKPYSSSNESGNWTHSIQVGGTPGTANFPDSGPPPQILINEIPPASENSFWFELINAGSETVNVTGFIVSVGGNPGLNYALPEHSMDAGKVLLIEGTALGFRPSINESLILYNSTGEMVLDSQLQSGRLRGRSIEHQGAWLYPDNPTPGVANTFAFHDEIVISEIFYNPPTGANSTNQWIEIANRSAAAVNLSGWEFSDGISFDFPAGTTLAAGEYACIARNPAEFTSGFPTARLLGEFAGSLSRSGERIVLSDTNRNPADEVRYYDGGRWPRAADGGGASLELRDLDADNNVAESWAASIETQKTSWNHYSYSGIAVASRGPDSKWTEFNMGLISAGEILIDDISVMEKGGAEKIDNVDFSRGSSDWRFRGTHRHSEIVDDPDDPGNQVLRIVASGPTEHMHNQIETTLLSSIINGREYTISYRARAVSGSNQLLTRLYFNRLPKVSIIARPTFVGTPSSANSQALSNIGPSIQGMIHSPAVPDANKVTEVSARITDPDNISSVDLLYSVKSGVFKSIPMILQPSGAFSASIPGQSAGTLVQFYIKATDGLAEVSMFPVSGPDGRAMFKVNDGFAATNGQHNFRILMLPDESNFMHQATEVMSNDRLGTTVIDREEDIYYNVRMRLKSSQRGRNNSRRVGFNLRFGADQPYRGVHQSVAIDRSDANSAYNTELMFDIMIANSGGLISRYYDFIKVLAPQDRHTKSAILQMARYGDVFLDAQFENGSDGNMYEYELIYSPNSADGAGNKLPSPDGVNGVRITDLGDNKEKYRWFFLKKNNRAGDDFSDIIAYNKKFAQSGAAFENGLEAVVDVDAWFRGMAYAILSGAGDNAAAGSQHNGMYFARPDKRIIYFPHDMDFSFSTTRSIFANPECSKLAADAGRRRMFLGHLHDIISTTYNTTYMSMWAEHLNSLESTSAWASRLSHITSRSNNVLSQIKNEIPQTAFNITTSNAMTVNGSTASISGVGWVDVRRIRLAGGGELDVTWTDRNKWQLNVQVLPGLNTITLEALNFSGDVIGAKTIIVNNTGTMEPASGENLVVSKVMFHPSAPSSAEIAAGFTNESFFEFVELMNIGTLDVNLDGAKFTAGINYTLPSVTLAPGKRAVLARNRVAYLTRHPATNGTLLPGGYGIDTANNFSNKGEQVVLTTFDGADIHRFTYGNPLSWPQQLPWPGSVDGSGFSVVLDGAGNQSNPTLILDWEGSSLKGKLRISEIAYDPAGGSDHEFIEFVNISGEAIDLEGVRLMPGAPAGEFIFGAKILGPGEHTIVVSNRSAFLAHHGNSIGSKVAGEWVVGKLSNGGENITVVDKDGNLVLRFSYDDRNGWPGRAAGKGSTLEVVDPSVNLANPDNWRSSSEYGGTPGTAGSVPVPGILINEILAHTDVPVLDTIELFNSTSGSIDISHWWISDSSDNWKKFQIPAGTTLAAGAYITYDEKDFNPNGLWNPNPGPRGANEFSLGSTGENAWIIEGDSSGKLFRFIDKAGFGASLNGISLGRHTNSVNEVFFTAQNALTLGTANSGIRVGPIVISEIMYHPEPDKMEWIELQNISDDDVPLFDLIHSENTWRVSGIDFTFPQNVTLEKRGMVILVNGSPDAFRLKHGIEEEVLIYGPFAGNLQDSGERIILERPDNPNPGDVNPPYVEADAVRYNDKDPWPTEADGYGFTIVRRNVDRFGTDPAHWKVSEDKGGTPGISFLPPPEPVIKVTGGRTIDVSVGTIYQDQGATAVDDVDGDVTAGITVDESAVDTSTTGTFNIWYTVTDKDGNESRKSRAVNVIPLVSPPSFLAHRYSFDGDGKTVADLVGSADATINGGAKLTGTGFLDLDGVNDYVDLPDGIISALGDATFETWISWKGPSTSQWQRILEFGDDQFNYLYLTPKSSSSTKPVRFAFAINGGEKRVDVPVVIPSDGSSLSHFAVAFNDTNDRAYVFVDGKQEGSRSTTVALSGINDINNWLGRSQYAGKVPYLKGTFHEFRIYKRALSEAEVLSSFQVGADKADGPVISAFTSATPKILPGAGVMLSWDIADAASITIDNGVGDVTGKTITAVTPVETTTYHLTAANSAGSVTIPFTVIVDGGGNPSEDSDGDGWTNEQENFLGTDPGDPKDGFTVRVSSTTAFNPPGGDFEYQLRWLSTIGRTYTIESTSDLKTWAEAAVVNGDGTEKTHSVQSREAVGFFRLKIE
ncbi:MAG: DUF5011 domain-containing protein [Opitutae bacterium]|nr:DUF5011 domain-containing protein [Opitutae bacterium]